MLQEYTDELFYKVFTGNPCPIAVSEVASGRYHHVNCAFSQVLGYSEAEVIGRTSQELELFAEYKHRAAAIDVMKANGCLRNFETTIKAKNGSLIFASFNADYIHIHNDTYLLTVMNDITSRKLLEREASRLEKLNLIGQLAAGISHEVRNPLTTIKGFLQLMAKKPASASHYEYYELMIHEIDRANAIITDFLSIAKPDLHTAQCKISLDKLLTQMRPLLESDALQTGHNIELQSDKECNIIANEKEIRQVILNLARNGFEAMPPGKTLSVKVLQQNKFVIVSVKDQGRGIDSSVLNKLGTPFLTTKESGTGLGLAVSYGIAQRHNAKIDVETSSDGTTFSIYFPVA